MKRFWLPTLVLMFGINSFAQSLADIARQERARQRAARSTVVVTSNGTGTPATSASSANAAAAPGQARPGAATSATTTGPTDSSGRDEKYWRAAFQTARDDIKRAEARVELLDLRVKDLNTQLLRQSDVYNRDNIFGAEITSSQKQLEDARKDADQARKKVVDLEDQLRRSGGLAGWSR